MRASLTKNDDELINFDFLTNTEKSIFWKIRLIDAQQP